MMAEPIKTLELHYLMIHFLIIMIKQGPIHSKVYDANSDRNSVIVNTLIQTIEARFIRIYPETWYGYISMRTELYGCEIHSGRMACI